jgi:hypothetical protein
MYRSTLYDDFVAGNSHGTPGCRACQSRHHAPGGFSSLGMLKACAGAECLYCEILLQGIMNLVPDIDISFGQDGRIRFLEENTIRIFPDRSGSVKGRVPDGLLELSYQYYTMGVDVKREMTLDAAWGETFAQARRWISTCFKDHQLCGADKPFPLPTRILDVGKPGREPEPTHVKLVEPAAGKMDRYVSLSHSWGGEQPLRTTTATLSDHKAGIEFGRLPRTFQDAVRITRRLGRRYLWIDSLCIIQDSPDDWQMEASRMAQVYRNSWLTLSATYSSSPSTGCLNSNQATFVRAPCDMPKDVAILFPEAANLRRNLRLFLRFAVQHPDFSRWPLGDANASAFPLLTRGWAYQERLLAPRVLHFGSQEIFWECMQDLDCECGKLKWSQSRHLGGYISRDTSEQLPPKISHYAALHVGATATPQPGDTRRQSKLLARWGDMVEEFMQRNLTFATDRLAAFSGVASEMVERLGMEYCAGLWKESMPAGLLWKSQLNLSRSMSIADAQNAPSWSWAAVNVPVEYGGQKIIHGNWKDAAELEEVRCVPAGKDPRGPLRLRDSYIVLSVFMLKAELCFEQEGHAYGEPLLLVNKAIESGVEAPLNGVVLRAKVAGHKEVPVYMDKRIWDKERGWVWCPEDEVYCAKMGRTTGITTYYWLVLRQRKGESVYERIGLISNTSADWECDTPKQRVKII